MDVPNQPTYSERLLAELDAIAESYAEILTASEIENVDLNRHASGTMLVGWPKWDWGSSDDALEAALMTLLRHIRDWEPRFRLLFPHPTPNVTKRLDEGVNRLVGWLTRGGDRYDIPSTIAKAQETIAATINDLRRLADLLPPDDYPVRLVVDTNALIDNPDLAAYTERPRTQIRRTPTPRGTRRTRRPQTRRGPGPRSKKPAPSAPTDA